MYQAILIKICLQRMQKLIRHAKWQHYHSNIKKHTFQFRVIEGRELGT